MDIVPPAFLATESAGDVSSVLSPMPCKITQVLVKPGQKVEKDQQLMILEAMKMEVCTCFSIRFRASHLTRLCVLARRQGALCRRDRAHQLQGGRPRPGEEAPRRLQGPEDQALDQALDVAVLTLLFFSFSFSSDLFPVANGLALPFFLFLFSMHHATQHTKGGNPRVSLQHVRSLYKFLSSLRRSRSLPPSLLLSFFVSSKRRRRARRALPGSPWACSLRCARRAMRQSRRRDPHRQRY